MEKIISIDGTPIAFYRSGSGPPLILVHGMSSVAARWNTVVPALEKHFTVNNVQRRGRGESGDNPKYSLEREYEDIAAVVDAAGEPATVLGHSHGGLCALGAAFLTENIRKLILYEHFTIPIFNGMADPDSFITRLEDIQKTGDNEKVLTTFYLEGVQMQPQDVELLKSGESWSDRISGAHTITREMRATQEFKIDSDRYRSLDIPVLFLLGSESSQYLKAGVEAFDAMLPESRIEILQGQGHFAMVTAPELFVQEIIEFVNSPWQGGKNE